MSSTCKKPEEMSGTYIRRFITRWFYILKDYPAAKIDAEAVADNAPDYLPQLPRRYRVAPDFYWDVRQEAKKRGLM